MPAPTTSEEGDYGDEGEDCGTVVRAGSGVEHHPAGAGVPVLEQNQRGVGCYQGRQDQVESTVCRGCLQRRFQAKTNKCSVFSSKLHTALRITCSSLKKTLHGASKQVSQGNTHSGIGARDQLHEHRIQGKQVLRGLAQQHTTASAPRCVHNSRSRATYQLRWKIQEALQDSDHHWRIRVDLTAKLDVRRSEASSSHEGEVSSKEVFTHVSRHSVAGVRVST